MTAGMGQSRWERKLMRTPLHWILHVAVMTVPTVHCASSEPAPQATEQWQPIPAVVSAPAGTPPSDAVVLFNGRNVDAWESVKGGAVQWKSTEGALIVEPGSGDLRSRATFSDIQLHLEFRSVSPATGEGQHRSNSGVFLMERYELQILDSYENSTYVNGQAAAVYKQYAPQVNASRPPGEWQSYDVIFHAPHWPSNESEDMTPARMTVLHNGVLVHDDVVLRGATVHRGPPVYQRHAAKLPIVLQDHQDRVAFRNIWVREIPSR